MANRTPKVAPKDPYNSIDYAPRKGKHADDGFPHFSSLSYDCQCLGVCCMGDAGCCCTQCPGFTHEHLPYQRKKLALAQVRDFVLR
jgi:hypothetical protein